MIDIAACAKHGVKTPGRDVVRKEVVQLLNDHFLELRKRLNVRISLPFFALQRAHFILLESTSPRAYFGHVRLLDMRMR